MLSAFLTYLNTRKVVNPLDKIFTNMETIKNKNTIDLSLKNIFRREK
jgi:hypothetical protein